MTPPAEHTEAGSQIPQPSSDIDGDGPSQGAYLSSAVYEDTTDSSPTLGIYKDKDVDQPLPPIYTGNQIPCSKDSSISAVGGFYQLKKFHFVGGLSLLEDIILYIASSTLEDISITVNHPSPQDLEAKNMRQGSEAEKRRRELDQETQLEIEAMEKATRIECGSNRTRKLEGDKRYWKKRRLGGRNRKLSTKLSTRRSKSARREERVQKHTTILQTVSSRWSSYLKTVKFNNSDESSQRLSTPPVLPKLVYGTLFCHPKLEDLELKQWELDSVEDFLLSMKSSGPENLKQLHLPINDPGSAISLYGLLDIAEACPMLESLQCCIDTLPPIPEYFIPTTKALSHGLQSLFIADGPNSLWDFNQLLLVARHLYLTFPRLQTIDSVEGPNAEQWVRICDLVKMFQAIRKDDVYRFS